MEYLHSIPIVRINALLPLIVRPVHSLFGYLVNKNMQILSLAASKRLISKDNKNTTCL